MNLKKLLIIVFGLLSVTVKSQVIRVVDSETNEPIEWVEVSNYSCAFSGYTNHDGQLNFNNRKCDSLHFRKVGYVIQSASIDDIKAQNFNIKLQRSNISIETVVISGTKWKQSSSKIPAKIISISPQDNELLNPQTAADLLSTSGNVFIQKSQQGGGSPIVRGFATNRLLYVIDGVRMNNAIFRSGNIQNVINIDPFAIENTEVIFGPNSVIYGSDAIGGVMNFESLIPEFSIEKSPYVFGKAISRFSSANMENTNHADINLGWKKWALVTSLSYWDFDHLRQGEHGPDDYVKSSFVKRINNTDVVLSQNDPLLQIPSAYSQVNFMQKIRHKPSDKLDLQYGYHYSSTSPYGRYDRHNRYMNNNLKYAEWNYGSQKWQMHNLSVEYKDSAILFDQINTRLAYQNFQESRITRLLNDSLRNIRSENVNAFSINMDFKKHVNVKNLLFYGFETVVNDVQSDGKTQNIISNTENNGPARYPDSYWVSTGLYINHNYTFNKKISAQSGIRYSRFHLNANFDTTYYDFSFTNTQINNGALTGSIGFVYKPASKWQINLNFGTAFRSPNVDDVGKVFDSQAGSVVVPNPDLKAEYAYNLDVGITKVFYEFLKIDATAYYTILNNALVNRPFKFNNQDSIIYDGVLSAVNAMQNAQNINVYGLQAGLEIELYKGLVLNSKVNWQKGVEELGDGSLAPTRHAAPLFGITSIDYKSKKIKIHLNVTYQDEVLFKNLAESEKSKTEIYALDSNGNPFAPSWYTVNFKTQYKISKIFSLNGGVENITNQRYRPYSSGLSGAGRNFVIAISAKF